MNAIEIRDLRKSFGATAIIRGTDLAVRDGERLALIGPNGAGKSTLFGLISGQLRPNSGSIQLYGEEVAGRSPYQLARAGLGRSFQVSNLFQALSVRENLCIAAMSSQGLRLGVLGRLRAHAMLQDRVEAMLDTVDLSARANTPVRDLSYAEQRLLEIGMTVAGDPRCILLDEPSAGMSRAETQRVLALIQRISQGRTLIMIEHDMNVVFGLADRIAVLVYGQVVVVDTPEAVRQHPEVRAAYFGQHHAQEGISDA